MDINSLLNNVPLIIVAATISVILLFGVVYLLSNEGRAKSLIRFVNSVRGKSTPEPTKQDVVISFRGVTPEMVEKMGEKGGKGSAMMKADARKKQERKDPDAVKRGDEEGKAKQKKKEEALRV